MASCGDVLSLQDLETAKKHQLFEAEVITGKAGGVSGGAAIDYATNQVTGQTQRTMPAILKDLGFMPAAFTFVTGGTLNQGDHDLAVYNPEPNGDNNWYAWGGALPKVVPAGSTPQTTGGFGENAWVPKTDDALRAELLAGPMRIRNDRIELRDLISVYEFGAKFDGGTDDTVALKAAFASGRAVVIPDTIAGHAVVSDTLFISSNTHIIGPGKDRIVIRAAASMDPNKHIISNPHIQAGVLTYDSNITITGLGVHANGFARTNPSVVSYGCGLALGAVHDVVIKDCSFTEPPLHGVDITCWKEGLGYSGIGHLGIAQGRSYNILLEDIDVTDWIFDDGITTHACYNVQVVRPTCRITDNAKALRAYTVAQKAVEVDDGSVGVVVSGGKAYMNGTQTTAYGVICHGNSPATYNVSFENIWAHGSGLALMMFSDLATDVAFDSANWQNKNIRVTNLVWAKPTLLVGSTTFASEICDIRGFTDVEIDGVRVYITDLVDNTYSAPVSTMYIRDTKRVDIKNVNITGVPGIPSGSYVFSRFTGWVGIAAGCVDITIEDFYLSSIGYMNHIISDNQSFALKKVTGLTCVFTPADGQTKLGIVSAAQDVEYRDVSVSAGIEPYRIGRSMSSYPAANYRLNQPTTDTIIGGLTITSETLADGTQAKPGILFRDQLAPTGTARQGCISFRTRAASEGRFSITAFHEDIGEYRPIAHARSIVGSLRTFGPAEDNTQTLGDPTFRWSVVFAASSVINTSDGREKTAPEVVSEALLDAADAIDISLYKWLSAIEEKGDDARWHFGPIAQQIRDAFLAQGIDGTKYGLLCYDKWDDVYQEVLIETTDEQGNVVSTPTGERVQTQVAGDRWGVRHDQCLWLLAAAARRRAMKTEDRLMAVEKRLSDSGL